MTAPTATSAPDNTFLTSVLARSATDGAFRQQLVAHPQAALAAHANVDVAAMAGLDVAFYERSADITLMLPRAVSASALTEHQLEMVSGGTDIVDASVELIKGVIDDATATLGRLYDIGWNAIK